MQINKVKPSIDKVAKAKTRYYYKKYQLISLY